MKTICRHNYPSDLCGICNPITKEESNRPSDGAGCPPRPYSRLPECPGTTHYAGCVCHEKGWENKFRCAVEMAAQVQIERDELLAKLAAIKYKARESLRISWLYCGRDVVMGIMREIEEIASKGACLSNREGSAAQDSES